MDLKNRFRFKFIIFLILVPAVYQAQELEKKRFVMTSLASPELVTTIDSLIRTLDGVAMLRVDFPTKNCVGLFAAEHQYNQQTFVTLLETIGIGVKCYTSEVFTGQPMPPVDATDCRGNSIPELLLERGIGACC